MALGSFYLGKRGEIRENYQKVEADYIVGMKYKDIADKYSTRFCAEVERRPGGRGCKSVTQKHLRSSINRFHYCPSFTPSVKLSLVMKPFCHNAPNSVLSIEENRLPPSILPGGVLLLQDIHKPPAYAFSYRTVSYICSLP